MTDLIEQWRNESQDRPDDYQPEVCPPDQAEAWTNTRNPGGSDHGTWEWDLLCDTAYVADSNPTTVQENVKLLLTALLNGDTE